MASNKAVTFNDTTYNPATGDVPKYNEGTGLWIPSGLTQNVGSVFTSTKQSVAGDIDFDPIITVAKNIYSFTGHIICVCDKVNASGYTAGDFCTWNIANTAAAYGSIGANVNAANTATAYPTAWAESPLPTQTPNFIQAPGPGSRFSTTVAFVKGKPGTLQFCVRIPAGGVQSDAVFRTTIVLIMSTTPYT